MYFRHLFSFHLRVFTGINRILWETTSLGKDYESIFLNKFQNKKYFFKKII